MPITLHADDLAQTLERAYLLAIGKEKLPATWVDRAERLGESPSVAFIAAIGAVLLAKATDPEIDAFVIQTREGSAGAFNLRAPATALAAKKRTLGYDIGSSSDRDPINHGTLVSSTRWDVALEECSLTSIARQLSGEQRRATTSFCASPRAPASCCTRR